MGNVDRKYKQWFSLDVPAVTVVTNRKKKKLQDHHLFPLPASMTDHLSFSQTNFCYLLSPTLNCVCVSVCSAKWQNEIVGDGHHESRLHLATDTTQAHIMSTALMVEDTGNPSVS